MEARVSPCPFVFAALYIYNIYGQSGKDHSSHSAFVCKKNAPTDKILHTFVLTQFEWHVFVAFHRNLRTFFIYYLFNNYYLL